MVARVTVATLVACWEWRIGLEVGAGQVVQQHVEASVEQVPPPRHQVIEQSLFVREQPVVTGVELVDLRQSEVRAEQIRQRAAFEPLTVQSPLAARRQKSVRHQHQQNLLPPRPLAAGGKPLRPEPIEPELLPQRQRQPARAPLPRPRKPHL